MYCKKCYKEILNIEPDSKVYKDRKQLHIGDD